MIVLYLYVDLDDKYDTGLTQNRNLQKVQKVLKTINLFLVCQGRKVSDYDLPLLDEAINVHDLPQEIIEEKGYTISELQISKIEQLNGQQRIIYDEVMDCVENGSQGVFFVDGPGGTGKTFLYECLLAKVRSQHKIALAVASSGIAALLLQGG